MKNKPTNMKYTDLCIYIDKTVYERDENNNPISLRQMTKTEMDTVYTYIYNIVYALAVKKKMMSNYADYDDFCISTSSKIYQRLTNPNQKFGTNQGKGKPVKSVLNYIKTILPFMAIDFRVENYSQDAEYEETDKEIQGAREYLVNSILQQYEESEKEDICNVFGSIDYYINKVVKESIFIKNKLNANNLSLSLYLSLFNMFTLPYSNNELSDKQKTKRLLKQLQNKEEYVVCWDNNSDITPQIINFNIKKILNEMQSDINSIKSDNVLSDDIINEIISSSLSTYGANQTEED